MDAVDPANDRVRVGRAQHAPVERIRRPHVGGEDRPPRDLLHAVRADRARPDYTVFRIAVGLDRHGRPFQQRRLRPMIPRPPAARAHGAAAVAHLAGSRAAEHGERHARRRPPRWPPCSPLPARRASQHLRIGPCCELRGPPRRRDERLDTWSPPTSPLTRSSAPGRSAPTGWTRSPVAPHTAADFSATGLLYGSVLRSPHAHARITSIDTSRAAALEGVRAVITNADFPQPGESLVDLGEGATTSARWLLDNVLAADKALYTGHAVAAAAATDPHIAEDALDLIDVEYEVLEPVLDVREAMLDSAPVLFDFLRTEAGRRLHARRPSRHEADEHRQAARVQARRRRRRLRRSGRGDSSANSRPRWPTRATSSRRTAAPSTAGTATSPSGARRRPPSACVSR